MDRQYQGLPIRELGANAGIRRPQQAQAARVTRESPALEVMTDLARVSPATIRPQAPIEGADEFMRSRGVRLLRPADTGTRPQFADRKSLILPVHDASLAEALAQRVSATSLRAGRRRPAPRKRCSSASACRYTSRLNSMTASSGTQ
jgi:hypothetical protein